MLILFWTPIFGDYEPWFNWIPLNNCKFCHGTTNRELLSESDAVYFHFVDLKEKDLPKFRKPNQIWICFNLESPVNPGGTNASRYKYFFNWTETYKSNSNLFFPYGRIYTHDNEINQTIKKPWLADNTDIDIPKPNITKPKSNLNKTRAIAWVVSNCQNPMKRDDYVRNLSSFIDVDIFGNVESSNVRDLVSV